MSNGATGTTSTATVREALRVAIRAGLEGDPNLFVMGQDEEIGGSFDVTAGLFDEFGSEQVRDTPISEAAEVGAGVGAAVTGTPTLINLSFSDFMAVCFDPIMNQLAKTRYMFGGTSNVPLVVRAIEGAGLNAAAQHSSTVHTLVSHLPGVKVVAPATPAAFKGLMTMALRSSDPVFFCENKTIYERSGPVPDDPDHAIPLGEASIERSGEDVTVVATQRLFWESLDVADRLAPEVSVEVIDPRSLYPLDTDTLVGSLERTGRLVVADESPLSYGFHAEVVSRVVESSFFSLDAPPQRVGVPDTPIPFSPPMEAEVLPGGNEVERAIRRTI